MSIKTRLVSKYRNEGLTSVLQSAPQFIYNQYIWPHLPSTSPIFYNQVQIGSRPVFDHYTSWNTPSRNDYAEYEYALIKGIRNNVISGDTVVIVGGGWGVSSVVAARKAGLTGKVITFEGGAEYTANCIRTIEFNRVEDIVDIRNLVVGTANDIRGKSGTLEFLSVDELPVCDVLVLDCEGTELEILSEMEIRPETIIVETHGMHDAATSKIETVLTDLGYNVYSKETAMRGDPSRFCIENDIFVLQATLSENK